MVDTEKIKKNSIDTFRHDIKQIEGVQWVPVTDAKAAIGFAITDTLIAVKDEQENEVADNSQVLAMVKNALDRSIQFGLQSEVIGFALLALKENPTLTISQALESGMDEWDV